jgi:hypothetical protein
VYAPYLTITDISAGDAAFTVDDNNSVIFKPRHNQDETGTGDATFEVQRADGTTMLAVSTLSRYVGVGDSLQVNAVDTGYTFNLYGSGTSGLMHGYRPTSTASEILMTLNSNVGGTDVAKFIVNAGGTVTLAGGQTTDITTASASTATALTMKPGDTTGSNGTGAALTLKGGDESSSTCGTSCTGGGLVLQGGSATGGSGTRNGGSVSIDAGTGNTANGAINIGTNSSATVTIGRTTGGGTTIIQSGTGGVSVGNDGVANTLQIGNTSGAVSQTVNIGNNATASSTHNVNIGSSIAGTVAIQGATTITNRTSGSADTLVVGNSTSTGNIAVFKDNSTTVFSIADGGAATFQNQTDSTTAFRVLNTSGAGSVPQFVIDTTNSRVYVGNPSSDTTGALLVLDTKSNSTDPTGVDGAMYYNSSMSQMRCYFDGRWRFCNDANTLSWGYDFREDFLGLDVSFIGEKGWSEDSSGTLAGYNTEDTDVASRPGQISIDVGTTNTGRDAVYFNTPSGTEPFFFGGGEEIEMAININTLATVAQDYIAKFGLCDVSDANDCIDGAWFEYDRATSANWRIATANNSSRTRTTSSTAVATGWVRLKIVANSSGTQLDYYVNDVNIGNVTTNIPSSSGRGSQPEFLMRKTAGTTQLTIKIDYFQMRNSLTTKR